MGACLRWQDDGGSLGRGDLRGKHGQVSSPSAKVWQAATGKVHCVGGYRRPELGTEGWGKDKTDTVGRGLELVCKPWAWMRTLRKRVSMEKSRPGIGAGELPDAFKEADVNNQTDPNWGLFCRHGAILN